MILYLLVGAGVLGTWCTVIFDQYFTSPTLFILLHYLKVKAIGTCQTNRRGWPSNQIKAEEHRRGKKVSQPGDAVFVHEVATCCTNTALSWVLTAVKWYDKNEVHILSNCSTDEEVEYEMKQKGQVDAVMTKQPVMRKIYTSNKVGVDVIDQTDARRSSPTTAPSRRRGTARTTRMSTQPSTSPSSTTPSRSPSLARVRRRPS